MDTIDVHYIIFGLIELFAKTSMGGMGDGLRFIVSLYERRIPILRLTLTMQAMELAWSTSQVSISFVVGGFKAEAKIVADFSIAIGETTVSARTLGRSFRGLIVVAGVVRCEGLTS
jgi:hypothetical protein